MSWDKEQEKLWIHKYSNVSVGYATDKDYNYDWVYLQLFCPYEHCIENQPIFDEWSIHSCPVFEHECPNISMCPKTWVEMLFYKYKEFASESIRLR